MARWAQQQHNDLPAPQPPPPPPTPTKPNKSTAAAAAAANVHPHDPGGSLPRIPLFRSTIGDGQQQQQQKHYHRDKANQLLRIVESQQQLGGNCTAGTDLNMGEGVVDRYAQVCNSTTLIKRIAWFPKYGRKHVSIYLILFNDGFTISSLFSSESRLSTAPIALKKHTKTFVDRQDELCVCKI